MWLKQLNISGRKNRPHIFIQNAKSRNEKVYLETHNKKNIAIYEKYGFKLINSKEINDSSIIHNCMIC
jgi:hypothetical protein